jgi:uncharacterized membrane protein
MHDHPLGMLHLACALAALGLGTVVAVLRKGTRTHLLVGRAYLGAMLVLNGTALSLYELTGRANPFHFFALVSLGSLVAGFVAARRRRPGWRQMHSRSMLWSYVGLLAAAASEAIVRVPGLVSGGLGFGTTVAIATSVVTVAGATMIRRTVARIA